MLKALIGLKARDSLSSTDAFKDARSRAIIAILDEFAGDAGATAEIAAVTQPVTDSTLAEYRKAADDLFASYTKQAPKIDGDALVADLSRLFGGPPLTTAAKAYQRVTQEVNDLSDARVALNSAQETIKERDAALAAFKTSVPADALIKRLAATMGNQRLNTAELLNTALLQLKEQAETLKAEVSAKDTRIGTLLAQVQGGDKALAARVKQLEEDVTKRDATIITLNNTVQQHAEARDAAVSAFQSQLDTANADIAQLKQQLASQSGSANQPAQPVVIPPRVQPVQNDLFTDTLLGDGTVIPVYPDKFGIGWLAESIRWFSLQTPNPVILSDVEQLINHRQAALKSSGLDAKARTAIEFEVMRDRALVVAFGSADKFNEAALSAGAPAGVIKTRDDLFNAYKKTLADAGYRLFNAIEVRDKLRAIISATPTPSKKSNPFAGETDNFIAFIKMLPQLGDASSYTATGIAGPKSITNANRWVGYTSLSSDNRTAWDKKIDETVGTGSFKIIASAIGADASDEPDLMGLSEDDKLLIDLAGDADPVGQSVAAAPAPTKTQWSAANFTSFFG